MIKAQNAPLYEDFEKLTFQIRSCTLNITEAYFSFKAQPL